MSDSVLNARLYWAKTIQIYIHGPLPMSSIFLKVCPDQCLNINWDLIKEELAIFYFDKRRNR